MNKTDNYLNYNELAEPVLFNCWKHHKNFLHQQIDKIITNNLEIKAFCKNLLLLGHSTIDLYFGNLSPQIIGNEIIDILKTSNYYLPENYQSYLQTNNGYQIVEISDQSTWALLWGDLNNRYLHIHPAKYSLHCKRLRATTLKTTLVAILYSKLNKISINLDLINMVRIEYLSESPIKSYNESKGLAELIRMIEY